MPELNQNFVNQIKEQIKLAKSLGYSSSDLLALERMIGGWEQYSNTWDDNIKQEVVSNIDAIGQQFLGNFTSTQEGYKRQLANNDRTLQEELQNKANGGSYNQGKIDSLTNDINKTRQAFGMSTVNNSSGTSSGDQIFTIAGTMGGGSSSGSSSGTQKVYGEAQQGLSLNKNAINHLYKSYFGRDATAQELQFWNGKTVGNLENQLSSDYQKASGISYDGSPINPGKTKTVNQLGTGGTGSGTSGGSTGTDGVDNTKLYQINSLYQKYFGRDAGTSTGEQNYWLTRPVEELQSFLDSQYQSSTGHAYDGSAVTQGNTKSQNDLGYDTNTQNALKMIDDGIKNGTIPQDVGMLFKSVVASYPKGVEFNTSELLKTFESIKQGTIDPHFRELTDLAIADVKSAADYMTKIQAAQKEQEALDAQNKINTNKSNLEASGLTFSGKAVNELGTESAYTPSSGAGVLTGTVGEGTTQAYNRLIATSNSAARQKAINDLGSAAEKQLGSEGMAGIGLPEYKILGGITGTIKEAKDSSYGSTLKDLINQNALKQKSLTNLQF
jgi:hypothetical protein